MTSPEDREQIRATLEAILADRLGVDAGRLEDRTRFFADLGLASIDAVVLGEAIQAHYGRPVPFGELMSAMGRRADRDLEIGELVDFLGKHLS